MKPGQWHSPNDAAVSPNSASSTPGAVIEAVAHALAGRGEPDWHLEVERQRLAGRSDIFILRGEGTGDRHARWVVKHPHTGWSQDDVGNPLSAQAEFLALERLHTHFASTGGTFSVPQPVALLPEIDAFAMEFVVGTSIKDLLYYSSVRQPTRLLNGLTAAGAFLRHLHALEALPDAEVDLRDEAEKVLAVEEEKLHPLHLTLPDQVRRTLSECPSLHVTARQTWLHGDFGPSNVILCDDGDTMGLDAALDGVGQPEDDLVRFVVLVSGVIRLAPEVVVPPMGRIRRELESRVFSSYYGTATAPPLFELRYLHQLCRRWCRLRELAEQHPRAGLVSAKLMTIGKQMQMLMADSERRLINSLGN